MASSLSSACILPLYHQVWISKALVLFLCSPRVVITQHKTTLLSHAERSIASSPGHSPLKSGGEWAGDEAKRSIDSFHISNSKLYLIMCEKCKYGN